VNRLQRYIIFGIAFAVLPWALVFIGLTLAGFFLSADANTVVTNLEALRNLSSLKAIGIIVWLALLFYGKSLLTFLARKGIKKPDHISQEKFEESIENAVDSHYLIFVALVAFVLMVNILSLFK
jgi:hypothetical protein